MKVQCAVCEIEFNKKPSHIAKTKGDKHYCSTGCAGIAITKKIDVVCAFCGGMVTKTPSEILKSKTGGLFCSHSCSAKVSNSGRSGGVTTYRYKAFKELPVMCNMCGYDKMPEVLQVHHKDRDRTNSNISNLQILCPTCHAEEHFLHNDGIFWNTKTNDG